ncbi:MAG TPA: DUF4234 domain-containing protein [Pyrinomonadaceae bacterium]|jgi:hypothetical protein|nr:DUF4234 domain-containing protein [Pyrinomonadaceae bacterium]
MIFCTKCGQQNDDAARNCANCGQPFGGQSGSTPFTTATPGAGTQQPGSSPGAWASPAYGDPAYGMQQAAGGGRPGLYAVGEKRDPIMVLVLSFVTCGIYGLYEIYKVSSELRGALGRQDINPTLDVVLGVVTCGLYFIYLAYRYPQLIMELQDRVGQPRNDISLISIILAICGLSVVSIFMIQTELNKVWDAARMQ